MRKNDRGYTLIETLIAVAILGITAAVIYGTLMTALKTNERLAQSRDRYRAVRFLSERITRQMESAWFSADDAWSGLKGNDRSVDFVTLASGQGPAGESGYFFEASSRKLYVRNDPTCDGRIDHGGTVRTLVSGVEGLTISYYDSQTRSWRFDWDSSKQGKLPGMVRFSLTFKGKSGKAETMPPIIVALKSGGSITVKK